MSNKTFKRALSCAAATSAIVAAIGTSVPAMAQIEEIIVTSQKREQSIQSIPISVTAFDASALESKQIDSFSDLQFNTPNVTFTKTNFTGSNFSIRGIGSAAVAASGDGGVGIHVNDAPMRSALLFETEYFDLERMEILRGPQGTLFGRNATGGVVNMITKKPTDEFEGSLGVQMGNYGHQKITAMLNIPISDTIGIRLAGLDLVRDGYTKNIHTGNDIDGRDQYAGRASLQWDITDATTFDLMVSYFEEDSTRARTSKQQCHTDPSAILGCLPDKLANETTNGWATLGGILTSNEVLGAYFGWGSIITDPDGSSGSFNPSDLREVNTDYEPTYAADETLITTQLEHQFDQHTLTLVASWKEASTAAYTDYNWAVNAAIPGASPFDRFTGLGGGWLADAAIYADGVATSTITDNDTGVVGGNFTSGPVPDGYDLSNGNSKQWTVELRLASDLDGQFNYLVGGFLMHTESYGSYYVVASGLDYAALVLGGPGAGALTPYYRNETDVNELDSWAIFGEAYFQFNDDIKFTGGVRFNNDEKKISDRQTLLSNGGAPINFDQAGMDAFLDLFPILGGDPFTGDRHEDSNSWEEMTGRLLVEWTPELSWTDSTLFYASYSRGYKGGGFNPASFSNSIPKTFEPEFINAMEVGMKNILIDNTLTANFTAFRYDYEGFQVSKIVDRSSLNENIDAEIWGLEAELVWAPNESWLTNLTFSYLNTEITDAESIDGRDPTDGLPGYLLIKDLSNASNCLVDPGATGLAVAQGYLAAAGALPFGTTAIPGLASAGALTTCAGLQGAIDFYDGMVVAPPGWVQNDVTITGGNAADLSGNSLQNSPEWSFNVGTQRTHFFDSGYSLTARVDYFKQADMFARIYNKSIDRIESWGMINLSATLTAPEGNWELKAFVQNAADDDNITGQYFTDPSSGNFTNVFILDPRLYGLSLNVRF